ncbi:armadillo-type protein [Polychytrium aggregatum]|uniref:armadillo-type protein n=1 Tax=Polychytrium aggregatum TaxID=110093 RepID=UPI0022FE5456|nr:armadillo-type protein [Polychytrium aggregatum]KAI9197186.1 armadillo-type protein [Polychytrium aggregatum]
MPRHLDIVAARSALIAARSAIAAAASASIDLYVAYVSKRQHVSGLKLQLDELSASYETQLASKQQQIEYMDKDLHLAQRAVKELHHQLNLGAYGRPERVLFSKENVGFLQRQNQALQGQVSELRQHITELHAAQEAHIATIAKKDCEINDLRMQLKNIQMLLGSKRNSSSPVERDYTFDKLSPQGASSLDRVVPSFPSDKDLYAFTPCGEDLKSYAPLSGRPSLKSIWSPAEQVPPFLMLPPEPAGLQRCDSPVSSNSTSVPDLGATRGKRNHIKSIWSQSEGYECSGEVQAMEHIQPREMHISALKRAGPADPLVESNESLLLQAQIFALESSSASHLQSMVDKILKTNDQLASLVLQQKLKTASVDDRNMIFDAVREHSLPLMKNRFGNFLMQRCLEFGTREHIKVLGLMMKGNVYSLACDRFGCHVVQKALDTVDEDLRSALVSELFWVISETITHRFACHVWQRVFEIKWRSDGSSVIQYVHSILKGQWKSIANDENGSLVVQCIFENCTDREKAPLLSEILAHTLEISKGQWGNWVIQHILEHGGPQDKVLILKVVAANIYSMSIDQYASKVVEKALKTASKHELFEMIDSVISPLARDNG